MTGDDRHETPTQLPLGHSMLMEYLANLADAGALVSCVGEASEPWISNDPAEQTKVAQLCQRCPALVGCREYGLANPGEFGVYGGLTERERRTWPSPETTEPAA